MRFGGSIEKAAESVKRALMVISKRDHTVTPQPALDFVGTLTADTLVLNSDCGHLAPLLPRRRAQASQ
jgi:homoserine O-acetyltransferase